MHATYTSSKILEYTADGKIAHRERRYNTKMQVPPDN